MIHGVQTNPIPDSQITDRFYMKPGELTIMTAFLYNFINVSQIYIKDCVNGAGLIVTPVFTVYYMGMEDAVSDNFYVQNNTYCSEFCNRCVNKTYCLVCADGYYL